MTLLELARHLRSTIEKLAEENLTDEEAVENVELFPAWAVGKEYATGDRIRHEGILYSVLQPHTSQADWTPDAAVSLYAKVLIPDPDVIPDWEQPLSTNPYMTGDKVRHVEKIWVSTIDDNVWEPGVYGWEEVIEQ